MINKSFSAGKSVIELLVIIAIVGIMLAMILPSLSSFRGEQTLDNTADDIVSLLNQARAQTLSSQSSTYYSVHFDTNQAVLFSGGTYTPGASTNKVVTFSNLVSLPSVGGISLLGGGSDVSFTRLTGDTTQYGTIIVRLVSDATRQKIITINQTGIVSASN